MYSRLSWRVGILPGRSPRRSKTLPCGLPLRLVVPSIDSVDPGTFERPPLSEWMSDFAALLEGPDWPAVAMLDRLRAAAELADAVVRPAFVAQSPALLADGQHYEERIRGGRIATREGNWHDLLNALVWLRWPRIKHALNVAQCADIARVGPRQRTRAQCALTHFDEAGAIVVCSDPGLIELWDRHDWQSLFLGERAAWGSRIAVHVFGHALLELALQPQRYLVAKTLVLMVDDDWHAERDDPDRLRSAIDACIAGLIADAQVLTDPQQLRPLPLSGIPGWHADSGSASFYDDAPCFRPLRAGRRYPSPAKL